jgi:hypothetical protein
MEIDISALKVALAVSGMERNGEELTFILIPMVPDSAGDRSCRP